MPNKYVQPPLFALNFDQEQVFTLPADLKMLEPHLCNYSAVNINNWRKILISLPPSVDYVKLGPIHLPSMPLPLLLDSLNRIPSSVTRIDLSSSCLSQLPSSDITQILSALSKDRQIVKLCGNELSQLAAGKFADALQYLSTSVRSLDLSANSLNKYSSTDLLNIIKVIPEGVCELNLSLNNLPRCVYQQIIMTLPLHVKVLITDEKKLNLEVYRERFKIKLSHHLRQDLDEINALIAMQKDTEDYCEQVAGQYRNLRTLVDAYEQGQIHYLQLKEQCDQITETSNPKGWKQSLERLIGSRAFYMVSAAAQNRLFSYQFRMNYANKMKVLEEHIHCPQSIQIKL